MANTFWKSVHATFSWDPNLTVFYNEIVLDGKTATNNTFVDAGSVKLYVGKS